MSQTGFTPISLYYSSTAAATPTAGNLVAGELAINTADGKLFYKDSSGVVQTLATKDTAAGTFTSITDSGNLTFTGTGNRIRGDFSNATVANSVLFQSSTTNGATNLGVVPNGTSTTGAIRLFNNSDVANSSFLVAQALSTEIRFNSNIAGTGTYLPLTMYTGGSERLRIDTSGNLLLGTTTAATSGSGSMNIAGYGNFTYNSGGTSVTTNNFSELLQNTTVLNSTGAASQNLTGIGCFPQGSHDATGGTNQLALNACSFQPNLTSTAATSPITLRGAFFGSVRNYAADTSSSASNQLFGIQASFGHATTLSTSALTANAAGVLSSGTMAAGSIADFSAFRAQLPINPTSGTVTVTSRYGFYDTGASIGASGGTANVTNYYGMLLSGTTVGATGTVTNYYGINITAPTVTGTITNRYGIFQSDTAGTNLLAAPTKISNGYTVATLPTGAAAAVGMKAYVTDALAPVFLTAVVGGGAVVTPVFHNGTTWVAG